MKKILGRPRIEEENLARTVVRRCRFTPVEDLKIDRKMEELGYASFTKMIHDLLFLSEVRVKKISYEAFLVQVNRVGNNINQIAYRLNANQESRLVARDLALLSELRALLLEILERV
jgi:hypothetical protein